MKKLKYYLQWWFEYRPPPFVKRHFDDTIWQSPMIPVLVGPRRSGKSTLFFQLMERLKDKVAPKNIIYINFEDDRLLPLEGYELSDLLTAYRQMVSPHPEQPVYLFLDEVQNVPDWEKSVRRIHETESAVKLFLTGSNSKMLSADIATSLRGRTLSYAVGPLNFKEYLLFKNEDYGHLSKLQYSEKKSHLLFHLDEYLRYGGFPEVVLCEDERVKERILKEYLKAIFFADIIERYELRQVKVMDALIRILARQMSSLYSVGKLYKSLKSIGYTMSKNTLIEYIGYLEEAFFGRSIAIYAYSVKDQLQYPRKFYLVDNGLFQAASFIQREDWGHLLENSVYLHLRQKWEHIHYWKGGNGYEIDFVLPDLFPRENAYSLIQVCYNFDDEKTKKREIRALQKAASEFKVHKGLIITRDVWDHISVDDLEIEVIPFIQWALGGVSK